MLLHGAVLFDADDVDDGEDEEFVDDADDADERTFGVPKGKHVISQYHWAGLTWYAMYFCDDRFYWDEGLFSHKHSSMSYDQLRNDPKITYAYLQKMFKDFPSEVVPTLMELKELE